MADGDILSVAVNSTGWYLDIKVEGLSTGGTYDFGYDTDFDPDDANVELSITSESFTAAGAATTMSRTLYGTKQKRKAYPDEDDADETVDGDDVIIRVALSDWVYTEDSSITVDIAEGLYTQGGIASAAATGLSVTNNSTFAYQPVIANWSTPLHGRVMGFDELTCAVDNSGEYEVRVMAFHRDGTAGKSIPCVKVIATGQTSSHVETIYLTAESIDDATYNDAMPIGEFIGNIDTSNFTQGEDIELDFIAYPMVGDASNIYDTSTATETMPTSAAVTKTVICDKNNTWGIPVAVVDGTNGNDSTGVVTNLNSFDSGSPPNAYATIGAAANAMRNYSNSNYSRQEYGGVIYMQSGSYAFTSVSTISEDSQFYTVLTPFPGVSRSSVSITSQSGADEIGSYVMFNNVTINLSSTFLVNGSEYAWFHKCDFQQTGATQQYTAGSIQYFTGCDISELDQGFRPYSTRETYTFVRGNEIEDITEEILAHSFIGNRSTSGALYSRTYFTGMGISAIQGQIYAYNSVSQQADSNYCVGSGYDGEAGNTIGNVYVNNVLEKKTEGSNPLLWLVADGTTEYVHNNYIVWNNTIVGQRANLAYNDTSLNGIGPAPRYGWSIKGNLFDDINIVTDVDSHGGTPSGDRTGNHALIHGCGMASNIYDGGGVGAPALYQPDFTGLKSINYDGTVTAYGYVDNASASGSGLGGGDYHLESDSPAIGLMFDWFTKYDIDEDTRIVDGAAGAYEYSSGGTTYNPIYYTTLLAGGN